MLLAVLSWGAGLVVLIHAAVIDPAWAGPLNTALLIFLSLITGAGARQLAQHRREVDQIKTDVQNAAVAATTAANATASVIPDVRDAARVAREVGGELRKNTSDPLPGGQRATDGGEGGGHA